MLFHPPSPEGARENDLTLDLRLRFPIVWLLNRKRSSHKSNIPRIIEDIIRFSYL